MPAPTLALPSAGDQLSVDHIIPRAVVPELDNVIANLELMPLRMNERKNAHLGQRQRDLAQKLFEAGLLSREGRDVVVWRARHLPPVQFERSLAVAVQLSNL